MEPIILESRPGRIVLGRYELLEQIGLGGFSTVYRAYDRKMEREVAVKAVRRTEELSERATREARAAAKLSHRHILTVFELAEDEHEVYIVSELVEGPSLQDCLDRGSLSDYGWLEATIQVLEALEHAHRKGVIHRDIKPDNIMIEEGQRGRPNAKVMDFGIAQLEDTQRITRRGDVVGTLSYMSPEQADGRAIGNATDVYSTALTLYVGLTGEQPFAAATAAETMALVHAGASPLRRLRPEMPRELSFLLEEAMDPDAELRPTPADLAAELRRILPELGGPGEGGGTGSAGGRHNDATRVLRRNGSAQDLYATAADRLGWIGARAASAVLAATLVWAAAGVSDVLPESWKMPAAAAAAVAVAILPRLGLAAALGLCLVSLIGYSVGLGGLAAVAALGYVSLSWRFWPRHALLPVLAALLGYLGFGLVYPAVCGSVARLKRAVLLGGAGAAAMTIFQLFGSSRLDYFGIENGFMLGSELAGEYNPWIALSAVAEPFWRHPVLVLQPLVWACAAVPAALLIRRRSRTVDLAGVAFTNVLLAAGYFALVNLFPVNRLQTAAFLKTFLVCVIIQFGLALVLPRSAVRSTPSPRERT